MNQGEASANAFINLESSFKSKFLFENLKF